MLWAILITVHMLGLTSYTLLLRKSAVSKLDPIFSAAIMTTGTLVPATVFLFLGKVDFHIDILGYFLIVLSAIFGAGYAVGTVYALQKLDASIYVILFNVRLFVTTLLGFIFLNELPSKLQILGGVIIFASILFLNLHVDSKWKSRPILIGIAVMAWFSAHATVEKYNINQVGPETYLFIMSFLCVLILWAIVYFKKVNIQDQLEHIKSKSYFTLVVTRVISGYSYTFALKHGNLAISNYISGMSVVLIVLFGIYFLGERVDVKQKFFATAIALVGMTLIMVSKI